MINISMKTIYQYDPMMNENSKEINLLLIKLFGHFTSSWSRQNIDFISQDDGINCGVFCLYHTYSIIKKKTFKKFGPHQFRKHIETELMKYKLRDKLDGKF